jgi:hypothetical protein
VRQGIRKSACPWGLSLRLAEPFRMWASVAVQADVPEDGSPLRTGLATLGMEYTF